MGHSCKAFHDQRAQRGQASIKRGELVLVVAVCALLVLALFFVMFNVR